MKRVKLLQKVAVFSEAAEDSVVIDNLKLCLSPVSLKARGRRPVRDLRGIKDARQLGVGYTSEVIPRRRLDGMVRQWKRGDIVVQQRVGGVRRGDLSGVSQTLDLNVIRLVRRSLGSEGTRFPQPETGEDNFVDPRVRRGRVVREVGLSLLFRTLEECVDEYRALLRHVFDVSIDRADVRVSLNEVELTWDRLCVGFAGSAHHAYWRAWRQHPHASLSGSGCMKRSVVGGEDLKLYPKTKDVLRYEAQLSGDRVSDLLDGALDFRNPAAVASALTTLGARYYSHIREVQAALLDVRLASLPDILALAWPGRLAAEHRDVFAELLATGSTKCRSQQRYRLLRSLRARGFVTLSKAKGIWVATPEFNSTFGALNNYLVATGTRWRAA